MCCSVTAGSRRRCGAGSSQGRAGAASGSGGAKRIFRNPAATRTLGCMRDAGGAAAPAPLCTGQGAPGCGQRGPGKRRDGLRQREIRLQRLPGFGLCLAEGKLFNLSLGTFPLLRTQANPLFSEERAGEMLASGRIPPEVCRGGQFPTACSPPAGEGAFASRAGCEEPDSSAAPAGDSAGCKVAEVTAGGGEWRQLPAPGSGGSGPV